MGSYVELYLSNTVPYYNYNNVSLWWLFTDRWVAT